METHRSPSASTSTSPAWCTSLGLGTVSRTRGVSTAQTMELPHEGVNLDTLERELVVQALRRTSGNQTKAAALLGLNRDQIRYRIEKFRLDKALN